MSVSFNVITKDCAEATLRALQSLHDNLYREGDEYIVVDTGSGKNEFKLLEAGLKDFPDVKLVWRPDLLVDYAKKVKEWLPECEEEWGGKPGLVSFSKARNIALEMSTKEVVFWIDSDDVIVEETPGQVRGFIDSHMLSEEPQCDAIFLDYHYAFAEDGRCTTVHKRERAFRRNKFFWKGNCHETAIPIDLKNTLPSGFFDDIPSFIKHTEDRKPHRQSDIRNYVILRSEIELTLQAGKTVDPRTLFYFANSCRGVEHFKEAIEVYRAFQPTTGSADDLWASHYYCGGMYLDPSMQRPIDALREFRKCLATKPADPRGHYGCQRAFVALDRHADAIREYERGNQLHIDHTKEIHTVDRTHIDYHPHVLASVSYKELEEPEKATTAAREAARARPDYDLARDHYRFTAIECAGDLLAESVLHTLSNLEFAGPNSRRVGRDLMSEFHIVPPKLEKKGISKIEPPDPRPQDRKSVKIFCGGSAEEWGPFSASTGIGGSEKMVILLAQAMQARGVNVSVYAELPPNCRGIDPNTGVRWHHWAQIDETVPCDALVLWRQPGLAATLQIPAKCRMVWLHDVPRPEQYTPEVIAATDKFQVQSEFHKVLLLQCGVPEDKIWVARNAIATWTEDTNTEERDPKRVVYMSSPDRGLYTVARVVKAAQKIDPEISLVAAYGINKWARKAPRFRNVPDLGHDCDSDVWEERMYEALDACGAQVLNRVSFERMDKLLQSSGAWLYPTRFDEISCMSAMEAQAHGVIPVSTLHGALDETIFKKQFSLNAVNEGEASDEWVAEAASILVNATRATFFDRDAMTKRAWEKYNIDDLADNWISTLVGDPCDLAAAGAPQVASVQPAD